MDLVSRLKLLTTTGGPPLVLISGQPEIGTGAPAS
jgi:hypothetical protein